MSRFASLFALVFFVLPSTTIAAERRAAAPVRQAGASRLEALAPNSGSADRLAENPVSSLILPGSSPDAWGSLDSLNAGESVDPNARLFDSIRALRENGRGPAAVADPSPAVLAKLTKSRDEYLRTLSWDDQRQYAEAIVGLMRERGIPAQTEKYAYHGFPHYFAAALPDPGAGHWMSKTATLLLGAGRRIGVAPEFSKAGSVAGKNVPDWGLVFDVAQLDEPVISPLAQHELGHAMMDEGVRHDARQPAGPPMSRVAIVATGAPRLSYDIGVVPERVLAALENVKEWEQSPLDSLKQPLDGDFTNLSYLAKMLDEHYSDDLGLEETWTHLLAARAHLDAAAEGGLSEVNSALYNAVVGWTIAGLAERLLREALGPGKIRVSKIKTEFEGDRMVRLPGGARLFLHSAQVNRGRPQDRDWSLDPASYRTVFQQALAETLADIRGHAAIAEAALAGKD